MENLIFEFINKQKSRGLSEHTLRAYQSDLFQLQDYLVRFFESGKVRVIDITKIMLRDYLRELSYQGDGNRTLARKSTTIKNFFTFCLHNNYLQNNPATNLKIPKFEKKLPHHFTEIEIETLLNIPKSCRFGIDLLKRIANKRSG